MSFTVSVAMAVVVVSMSVMTFSEKHLLRVVVACISENAVLDIAAEEALLAERHGILK